MRERTTSRRRNGLTSMSLCVAVHRHPAGPRIQASFGVRITVLYGHKCTSFSHHLIPLIVVRRHERHPSLRLHQRTNMNQTVCAFILAVLFLSDSTASQAGTDMQFGRFEFALIGDMPYDARQEKEFANVMRQVNAADLAFVVHDGDFWWDGAAWTSQGGGLPPCSDEAFQDRLRSRAKFQTPLHPCSRRQRVD